MLLILQVFTHSVLCWFLLFSQVPEPEFSIFAFQFLCANKSLEYFRAFHFTFATVIFNILQRKSTKKKKTVTALFNVWYSSVRYTTAMSYIRPGRLRNFFLSALLDIILYAIYMIKLWWSLFMTLKEMRNNLKFMILWDSNYIIYYSRSIISSSFFFYFSRL